MSGIVESRVGLVGSYSDDEKLLGNAAGRDDWNEKEDQQQILQANLELNSGSRHRPERDLGPAHCVKLHVKRAVCRKIKTKSTKGYFEQEH